MSTHVRYNNLLDGLGSFLNERLEEVMFRPGMNIYPADRIDAVYFPIDAMVGLICKGTSKQVAAIGNEGMVGYPVLLGTNEQSATNVVIVPGTALKLTVSDLHQALERHGNVKTVLTRYVYDALRMILQEAACSQLHTVRQRCARWLLDIQDRTEREAFPITQHRLAELLGVRRATINPILRDLFNKGSIKYVRGKMMIIKREELVTVSCGCHFADPAIEPTMDHASALIMTMTNGDQSNGVVLRPY